MLNNSKFQLTNFLENFQLPSWVSMSFNWQEQNKRYFEAPNEKINIQFFIDQGWIGEVYVNNKRELISLEFERNKILMNLFTHDLFSKIINEKILWLKTNNKIEKINNEIRSFQWIQASLITLKQAITKSAHDEDLLLEVKVFNGVKDSQNILRLLILSLDIEIYFLPNQALEVKFTDTYKNELVFHQFLSSYKNDFFNEIILLLNHLTKELEVR